MKIGLTQRVLYHKGRAYDSIEHGWYSYLKEHTLTFIENRTDQDFQALADTIDLLIITGGDDSTLRRTVELKLATQMMLRQKPIIGVCHGALLLTDVLGGKVAEIDNHHDCLHNVNYFGDIVTVNSFHNLYIKTTHTKATVLVTDPEGNCESWIDNKIAAVMWHPERMLVPWLPDEIQNFFK